VQLGSAVAVKLFDRIGVGGTTAMRLTLGALVLALVWRPWRRRYSREELLLVFLFGLTFVAMNLFFYEAIDRISLGVAVTIEVVGPIMVAVLHNSGGRDLRWPALALLGVVLIAQPWRETASLQVRGVIYAALAAAGWGAYILVAERAGKIFSSGDGLALAMLIAALITCAYGIPSAGSEILSPASLAIAALVAVLSTIIPYSFEFEALRRMPPNVFGVLMAFEPVAAATAGLVILGQTLAPLQLAAVALVVVAGVGVTRASSA
jgi:inner membrane transporter RhtA